MPKIKKRKKKLGGRSMGSSGGGAGKKVTPLRPYPKTKTAPCQSGCPMGNDVRRALTYVGQEEKFERATDDSLEQAWYVFTNTNPMPSVLGRVCPHPCESECNRQHKDGAVNINQFERFVGDFGIEKELKLTTLSEEKKDKKIAVIGSGPAGISCAYQLARRGYPVTIFEAFPKTGGMLRYGIPPYRLPRNVLDAEIQRVLDLGVELKINTAVGKDIALEEVQKNFDVTYVAIGAHKGRMLGAPGEDAENIITGAEFLNKINSGETIEVGDDVVVVGGGDSAIDAARVCKRLGANTTIVYRRTKAEMPAIAHEIDEAEDEGIGFEFLSVPVEAVKEGNKATKLICQRMELGEPVASGRRRPVPIKGDTYERSVSTLISAISQEPEFIGDLSKVGNAKDWIKIDEQGKTSLPNTFAGGDATNLGLVTIAIGQGRMAAEVIDAELRGETYKPANVPSVIKEDKIKMDWYPAAERQTHKSVPVAERFANGNSMTLETNLGLERVQAVEEAKRCFSCGMCMNCDNCWMYCQDQAVTKLEKSLPVGQHYAYKHELCTGCEKCAEECPCGFIDML